MTLRVQRQSGIGCESGQVLLWIQEQWSFEQFFSDRGFARTLGYEESLRHIVQL